MAELFSGGVSVEDAYWQPLAYRLFSNLLATRESIESPRCSVPHCSGDVVLWCYDTGPDQHWAPIHPHGISLLVRSCFAFGNRTVSANMGIRVIMRYPHRLDR